MTVSNSNFVQTMLVIVYMVIIWLQRLSAGVNYQLEQDN